MEINKNKKKGKPTMHKYPFPTQARLHNLFDLDFDEQGQPFFIRRNFSSKRSRICKPTKSICNRGKRSEHSRYFQTIDGHSQQYAVWIFIYVNGDYDRSVFTIDHINRDPVDNRISNLRLATWSDQLLNRGKIQRRSKPTQATKLKFRKSMKGRSWWNNGIKETMAFDRPRPEFVPGRLNRCKT